MGRARRATPYSAATPVRPSGCGGAGPFASLPLPSDGPASRAWLAVHRLAPGPAALATRPAGVCQRPANRARRVRHWIPPFGIRRTASRRLQSHWNSDLPYVPFHGMPCATAAPIATREAPFPIRSDLGPRLRRRLGAPGRALVLAPSGSSPVLSRLGQRDRGHLYGLVAHRTRRDALVWSEAIGAARTGLHTTPGLLLVQ